MRLNVKRFLEESGITEAFYPGKRLVHQCRQPGDFKSHCVVLDWTHPEKIRIELKAGLTGRALKPQELKYYPVSFKVPTYVDVEIINDNQEDDEGEGKKGSASGGGKSPRKSLKDLKSMASGAFGEALEGKIPTLGAIVDMVVLGTKIAAEAYGSVLGVLSRQIAHAKITASELLAAAGDFVTRYTPPAFMAPKGDEQKVYKYDRTKNADIGYRPGLG